MDNDFENTSIRPFFEEKKIASGESILVTDNFILHIMTLSSQPHDFMLLVLKFTT